MKALFCAALVALCVFASDASAVGCGVNRGGGVVNINRGVQQRLIGNQLITFGPNGNVIRRQFVGRNALVNINGISLQDRLIGLGF